MRLLQSLVSLSIVSVAAAPAYADPPTPRLFVPVLSTAPDANVDKVLHAFERAPGQDVIPNGVAALQFERLRSREPVLSSSEEIASIDEAAEDAVRLLGSGRLRPGQKALEHVEGQLEGARGDAYRRSHERVQRLFDACSLSAMLLSRAKRRTDAAAQMEHCVRTYPGSAPEGEPEIQPLFDATAERIPHGILRVEGDAGCVARANGVELGRAPLKMTLPVGNYRVQLECADEPGRIHTVRVGEGETRLTADPLDASVRTARGLWLRHSSSGDAQGDELGRMLSAQVVLLVGVGERVRVRTGGRDIAVVEPDDDVRPILPLIEAPAPDGNASALPRSAPEPALEPEPPVAAAAASRRSALEYVAGISLLAVGTGSLTLGWVFYVQRHSLRTRSYGEVVPYDSREQFADLGTAVLGLSAFGAAMLVAAEPFLVSDDDAPGAAWVLAAGGLVLVATGIGFGAAEHCEPQGRAERGWGSSCGFVADAIFGPLMALHGLPLLTLPVMYGFRQLIGGESTLVLGFNASAGHIGVRGAF